MKSIPITLVKQNIYKQLVAQKESLLFVKLCNLYSEYEQSPFQFLMTLGSLFGGLEPYESR